MGKFPNFLVVGGLVLFGVFVLSLVMQNYARWRQHRELPLSGDESIVVEKRLKERFSPDTDRKKPNSEHFITFQIGGTGERVEMRVTAENFAAVNEGDKGILWHQGIIFHRFENR